MNNFNTKQIKKDISYSKVHVLTRPNIDSALIILRKSKKGTAFLELNFLNNTVNEGQWIQGKVYERRCDLSENGKYIIYFAAKFHKKKNPRVWTAVSKFPYFKALDFYEKRDTYNGGGFFLSKDIYLLNETYAHTELYKNSSLQVKRGKLNDVLLDNETDGIYYPRLRRDGWKDSGEIDDVRVFTKKYKEYEIEKACYINKSNTNNRGVFYDVNTLKINGKINMRVESDWMDFKNDKLYWTNEGKIFYARLEAIENVKLIKNLNNFQYKSIMIEYD